MWNSKRFFQCKLNRGMFVRKDQVEFKTLVLTQTWNTLDNHQEQLNLKRAEQTKVACDALSILAKELVLSKPPLPRTLSELPTTYDGPELHWPLTLPNVLSMMEHFKLGHDLYCILLTNGLPSGTNKYLFNGDFVDRGHFGAEVVLVLLCFKLLYPNGVFLNRGNHESRNQNSWMGFEEEILRKYNTTPTTATTNQAVTVLAGFQDMFDTLPLCALVLNRIFIVHGGLFSARHVTLDQLNHVDRFREPPLHSKLDQDRLFEEMLWSDPRTIHGQQASVRGAGVEFGEDVTNEFCSVNKVALVIRSHECVPEGYAVLHGGRLITLFSASKYCGTQMNKGAFCSLKADCRPEIQQFIAPPLHTYSRVKPMFPQYNSVGGDLHLAPEVVNEADMSADTTMHASLEEDSLRMIAERICEHKSDLFRYFTQHEHAARNGRVSRVVWADALKAELKLDLPFLLYQTKLVDVEADNTINYSNGSIEYDEFAHTLKQLDTGLSDSQDTMVALLDIGKAVLSLDQSLEAVFQSFDTNGDGVLQRGEFEAALTSLGIAMPAALLHKVVAAIDLDGGNTIEYKEFLAAFSVADMRTDRRGGGGEMTWQDTILQQVAGLFYQHRIHIRMCFRLFDQDNSGCIDRDQFRTGIAEFNTILDSPLSADQIDALLVHLDKNGDGVISYKEFLEGFQVVSMES
ncbi:hypothetical protein DYB38_003560 [Aphanomyces astaci]|uniref:Serine/threonine-protein phosphatase n=1 Tax=Aphanomyces astaci TaxID=112090 RepID=A0A397C2I0_APHAT|nr:hypothetical protein DYB38_003560 [Aphanomyces astaci]